jgi:signal transduction histidine kinase/ActR/RegA family two-component response regulator
MTYPRGADRILQAGGERLFYLLQQMPGFVAVLVGPKHIFEYVNDAYVSIAGPRNFLGRSVHDVFPELRGQGFYELLDRVYTTGEPYSVRATPIRLTNENSDRYIDLLYQPIRDDQGAVTGVFVGGYDATERVREQRYRDALVRLTGLIGDLGEPDAIEFAAAEILGISLNASRVGYGTIDRAAETLHVQRDWNAPGVETLAGVVPLRVYGSFIDSLKLGEFISIDNVEVDERTAASATALKERNAYSFVNVPVLEHGTLVAVLFVNNAAIRKWSPEELTFIREVASRTRTAVERSRNDTALRQLNATLQERIDTALREQAMTEEALRQAQKMEAVGQLTGGLAHDFNNLLAGIIGSIEVISALVKRGKYTDIDRFISAAQNSSRRAATLTQRLLAFSRRQTLDPKPTDVNRLVSGMEDLIRRTVGPTIELEVVGAGGLWTTKVDPSQLENALLNLCINARDAMAPDGGRLTLETANKWLDERASKDRDLPPGQYISLCVTDTGTGMTPDIIARAFDPFFTTKPVGEGTGLGLSMVYGFARQSGGQVRIYSEVGKGTTMCIYLPRHIGISEKASGPDTAHPAETGQGESVLVVDDEPTIRMLIREVLIENGYSPLEASDGPAALAILRSNISIDLLVTDVGLPGGLNGRQVADAARVSRPELKVLFITGYAENAAIGNGVLEPGMEVITKPFVMATLGNRIRQLIAREPQAPSHG